MKYFWFLIILVCIKIISFCQAQQYYDPTDCPSNVSTPGSRYTCKNLQLQDSSSCKTFLVYRANRHFQTISRISELFDVDSNVLLKLNNLTSPSEPLQPPGREVLVPIGCSCTAARFFQANLSYTITEDTASMSEIACGVFEGLVKLPTLAEENPNESNIINYHVTVGSKLQVPLKCACPDNFAASKGVKYLVTYPFVEDDETIALSQKFGISPQDLGAVNHLEPKPTIFPKTTVLVPLRNEPVLNLNIPSASPSPPSAFLPTISVEKPVKNTKPRNLFIAGCVVVVSLVFLAIIGLGLYIKVVKKWKSQRYQSFNGGSSPKSPAKGRNSVCLSPDLLVGIKFSLFNYAMDDIKIATRDFSEENKMGSRVYMGVMNNVKVVIKQMRFENTRRVIDVHSKINHINIVKLLGVCYGEDDFSWSYLVFEYPANGSLRNCLSNPSSSPLRWFQRAQIAFDVATGLHYLNCCTFPSYAHMNLHNGNIFVTSNFRAKLGEIGAFPLIGRSSEKIYFDENQGVTSSMSEKVDVFAFGIVLLELISGREDNIEGKSFKESIKFLGGEKASEGGCFEQLRSFMDPSLKDYSLAGVLCLAVLAKACLEDDPLHRPSLDDIIKVLARVL